MSNFKKILVSLGVALALTVGSVPAMADGGIGNGNLSFKAGIEAFKVAFTFASDSAAANAYKAKCRLASTACSTIPTNYMFYNTALGKWRIYTGAAWADAVSAPAANVSMQDAYTGGNAITLAGANAAVNVTDSRNNNMGDTLTLTRTKGFGKVINISNSGSGADIAGVNWSVSPQGALASKSLEISDAAGTSSYYFGNTVGQNPLQLYNSFKYSMPIWIPAHAFVPASGTDAPTGWYASVGSDYNDHRGGLLFAHGSEMSASTSFVVPDWADPTYAAVVQIYFVSSGTAPASVAWGVNGMNMEYGANLAVGTMTAEGSTLGSNPWWVVASPTSGSCYPNLHGACPGGTFTISNPTRNAPYILTVARLGNATADTTSAGALLLGVKVWFVRSGM